jgi:hypothetical protein
MKEMLKVVEPMMMSLGLHTDRRQEHSSLHIALCFIYTSFVLQPCIRPQIKAALATRDTAKST